MRCDETKALEPLFLACESLFSSMPYQFFSIVLPDVGNMAEELNSFLSTHRIIDKHWETVLRDGVPYQVCRVEYVKDGRFPPDNSSSGSSFSRKPAQVDYREVLSEDDFRVFDELRKARKKLAESEKVDAFMVFTNAQLAEMVTNHADSMEALKKIKGVGDAHLTKYGNLILEALRTARTRQCPPPSEDAARNDASVEEKQTT